jgi:Ni2+-binding GTPase involved in maturation of urease and hydrogenase
MTPVLVIAGGFLGAGKTTLLLKAAAILRQRGLRVAMITNDQGTELVDTRMAAVEGVGAAEISGGCFCCRFTEFLLAAERLLEFGPDVIFAEPVGSCIDLASMMRRLFGGRFRVAPLTVLVDPERARELLAPGADPDLVYLFRNQVAEAEILCSTRGDVNGEAEGVEVRYRLSGRTGEGVEEWLAEVLSAEHEGGRALIIVVNKWDQMKGAKKPEFERDARDRFKFLDYAPIAYISAKTGAGVEGLFRLIRECYESASRRITTGELNRFVDQVHFEERKIFYITQHSIRPPAFVVFTDRSGPLHFSNERYLINQIRKRFGFQGTPIVLKTRAKGVKRGR